MTKSIDFKRYEKFVDAVTSDESTDFLALSDRLVELDRKGLLVVKGNLEKLVFAIKVVVPGRLHVLAPHEVKREEKVAGPNRFSVAVTRMGIEAEINGLSVLAHGP